MNEIQAAARLIITQLNTWCCLMPLFQNIARSKEIEIARERFVEDCKRFSSYKIIYFNILSHLDVLSTLNE